ncbi:hypothetical protein [Prosthecomicrobium sp. N25]|uniref:hypothetical protein n=1 Tax=Prosthecomicrobium sp. N25 TaxID=3129254 RepID=UPI003076EBBF
MAATLLGGTVPAHAATGSVRIKIVKAGFVVGLGGGSGVLNFGGRQYPLKIGGVSLGAIIGVAEAELVGRATGLTTASDITGTYTALGAGVAVAGGATTVKLQNSRGVILTLTGKQIGIQFSVALSGMTVSIG